MHILVDYLTISIRQLQIDDLLKILHLENLKLEEGYSRYLQHRYYIGGITIHYGDYIILEMSGRGCRFLESLYDMQFDWIGFIEQFLALEGSHLARIDIACDDKPESGEDGVLSFSTMARHCTQRKYICRSRKLPVLSTLGEESIYFGSPQSERRLRIYNKAMERDVDGHWIRAEFQLRNDAALSYFMRAWECGSIGLAYQGMLIDYLRFTKEVNDANHTERLTVTRWWQKFCGYAKKIRGFYVGGLEYNLESLERYLTNQTSSSLRTFLSVHKDDGLTELVKIAESADLNEKQKFLVQTQPLIDKMQADYGGEAAPGRVLRKNEALALYEAQKQQKSYEERYKHWTPLACSLDEQAAENSQNIMSALAAQDLDF